MEKIRLQKYLSQAWICSRRKAEEYILDWLVKVNWIVAEIWQSITPWEDKIELLQKAIDKQKNLVYYKLNKPRGIVTTCAQNQEKNIIDIINKKESFLFEDLIKIQLDLFCLQMIEDLQIFWCILNIIMKKNI